MHLFQALSDPTRVLLLSLQSGQQAVHDLTALLG